MHVLKALRSVHLYLHVMLRWQASDSVLSVLSVCLSVSFFLQAPVVKKADEYDDLFDEDDDRLMDDGVSDSRSPAKRPVVGGDDDDDDDDGDLMPATGRVKNRGSFLDDDNSLGALK